MPEHHVGFEEFVTPGRDRARARVVHEALRHLADGSGGEVLREMAQEVLSGRMRLHEAVRVGAYSDALTESVETAQEAWERLSPEQREERTAEARRFLASRAEPPAAQG
ncbi:hypothetical protein [Streptomyces hesseae]|uniref:Uncharacterized protein n=1 Tax=Streptomyces hesseae TaxID=3075519 RepID=A0ABU2SS31_9ACTN|nr:hypothetical protein [Streptomyces sp. DSM 40473]MDT0451793.1 hypothetical protein [Streptomyces sp. DSM 40473]